MDNGELSNCDSPSARSSVEAKEQAIVMGKRKFMNSPVAAAATAGGGDDVDVGAISPRKLQIAHHHNNNDVSFVLLHQDTAANQSINAEDLQNNNDEVALFSFVIFFYDS